MRGPLTECLDKAVWCIMWSRVQPSGLCLGGTCDLHRPQGIPGGSGLESALWKGLRWLGSADTVKPTEP